MKKRVVIVGAGMTGLACAWARRREDVEVIVLEAGSRVGGNIRTIHEGGFVMDAGPDAWIATKPEASALARAVGLEEEIIGTRPDNRRVYVAHGNRLHAMPEGVVLGVPTRIGPMVTTRLFSLRGKARMGLEPLIPRRRGTEEESVAGFITRRLGREAVERLAGPLLGGIFAGDAERISVDAAFPQLVEQEAKYGSLIVAMRAGLGRKPSNGSAPKSAAKKVDSVFLSLRNGMATFPEALARTLDVRLDARVLRLSRSPDGSYDVAFSLKGATEHLRCDAVVMAVSPSVAGPLMEHVDDEIGRLLGGIRCGSSAAVFLAYRRADVAHPLDASGFVVARSRSSNDASASLAAATFVSSKWDHRIPEGHVLLRAFLGGAGREAVLSNDDDALASIARAELGKFLGRLGEPVLTRVFRHERASPQPDVGHTGRMRTLDERLARLPGLYVIGNGYRGTGIPDCIKQANAVAQLI